MASLFSARRKPKRIAREDPSEQAAEDDDTGPVVRRPGAPKQKSRLRVAFDPDGEDDSSALPSENDTAVLKPSKTRPSTALQDRLRETTLRERDDDASRPSYSKSYLDELRNSTPSTPRDLTSITPPAEQQLDIASKFPATANSLSSNTSHIPSATEIAAFKARRARLAHEEKANEDFIPLDDTALYDSDGEFKPQRLQVGTYVQPSSSDKDNTRLIPDDEDIMEGFESYTEDHTTHTSGGRITMDLSRRAERSRRKAEKETMRQQIATAQATSDSSASDYDSSDAELHMQYETAQFHAGLDGLSHHAEHTRQTKRPKPPKITVPIEKLSVGLGRLKEQIVRIEMERVKLERRQKEIENERKDLDAQRQHVQKSLEEASRELELVQGVVPPTTTRERERDSGGGVNGDRDGE